VVGAPATTASAVRAGGVQVLVVALVVGVVWGLARWALDAYVGDRADRRATTRSVAVGALAFGALALVVGALVFSGRIANRVSDQWHAFTSLQGEGSGQRLASGGGNRYDFWRIALIETGDHPFAGVGAGNYGAGYFRDRRTDQDVRQPHSLPLQTIAELGIVGFGLLLAFVGAVAVGLWRRSRAPGGRTIAIAAGGAFVGWFSGSWVDWLALIPGLTGFALCAGATLAAPLSSDRGARRLPRWLTFPGLVAAVALIGFGGYTIGRLTLADADQRAGAAALASDPRAALRDANVALDLNDASLQALFTKARALAAMNDYPGARAALLSAVAREPHNFSAWSLLGDLALQRGDLRVARASYQRASTLNPRDAKLQRLARDPTSG
jgi:MFS family permease